MPTATLVRPKRLTVDGFTWEQGKPVPVSDEVALALVSNPRFRVEGLKGYAPAAAGPKRPSNQRVLMNQIRAAIDELEPEDEHAWAANGLPNRYALSFAVGYEVSMADLAQLAVETTTSVPAQTPAPEDTDDDGDEGGEGEGGEDGGDEDEGLDTATARQAAPAAPKTKPKPGGKGGIVLKKAAKAAPEQGGESEPTVTV